MPRPRNSSTHLAAAIAGLVNGVQRLVEVLQRTGNRDSAVAVAVPRQAGAGKGNPRLQAAIKSSWARYTPKQRAARIAAMKAGHAKRKRRLAQGTATPTAGGKGKKPPPAARKPAAKIAPRPAAKRKSAWASMTPEQRAERVAKMRAGRAAKPAAPAREVSLLND